MLTVVVLIVRFCLESYVIEGPLKHEWTTNDLKYFVKYFIIGVTVLVVAVPEGLPLAVTLALAYSVRVGMLNESICRKLSIWKPKHNIHYMTVQVKYSSTTSHQ